MPPKKKTATDAAIDEVAEATLVVKFRGEDFTIAHTALASPSLGLAFASGRFNEIVYAFLAPGGSYETKRFLSLCKPGDTMASVSLEFLDAVNEASGLGNS